VVALGEELGVRETGAVPLKMKLETRGIAQELGLYPRRRVNIPSAVMSNRAGTGKP